MNQILRYWLVATAIALTGMAIWAFASRAIRWYLFQIPGRRMNYWRWRNRCERWVVR